MKRQGGNASHTARRPEERSWGLCRASLSRAARSLISFGAVLALMAAGSLARAQSAAHAAKADETPAGNAENGKKLFAKYGCYECHGREAQGGGYNGPRLAPDPVPFSVLQSYIRHPQGEMPPYTEKVVSDKDLADMYAFLRSQSEPPAVKSIPILNH
jgi:mono/diheme cytochrome c family protein